MSSVMPITPLSGVRISWLTMARKRDFASLAASGELAHVYMRKQSRVYREVQPDGLGVPGPSSGAGCTAAAGPEPSGPPSMYRTRDLEGYPLPGWGETFLKPCPGLQNPAR